MKDLAVVTVVLTTFLVLISPLIVKWYFMIYDKLVARKSRKRGRCGVIRFTDYPPVPTVPYFGSSSSSSSSSSCISSLDSISRICPERKMKLLMDDNCITCPRYSCPRYLCPTQEEDIGNDTKNNNEVPKVPSCRKLMIGD